ncbi:hypothetical protein HYR99_36060 [Candidatus Poribacteria bacterium]|nr:hypothetical protein [Candidatus Poribacteria bacterium]
MKAVFFSEEMSSDINKVWYKAKAIDISGNSSSNFSEILEITRSTSTLSVTITTSIGSGTKVLVDGERKDAPYTTTWTVGSSHTIGVDSPQSGGAGKQYVFQSWSDGQPRTHTVTASASTTSYTATLRTQWKPTIALNGTDATHTVSTEAHTKEGSSHLESGLYGNWSDWCDDRTELRFSQSTTGTPAKTTSDPLSWKVSFAFSATITYTLPTEPPTISPIPDRTIMAGDFYTETPSATSATPMTWSLVAKPAGMTVNSATGVVTWASPVEGTYPVVLKAENSAGFDTEDWTVVVVTDKIEVWPGDTNNDGVVDEKDILPLGVYWRFTGPAPVPPGFDCNQARLITPWEPLVATYADANGDGVVDEKDVLPIGVCWGKTHPVKGNSASPSLIAIGDAVRGGFQPEALPKDVLLAHEPHYREMLKILGNDFPQVREVLLELLTLAREYAVPARTALLPNYPNPFNPETWIPFRLAESSPVTIRIFDARGNLVRALELGYREAGSYTTRQRAAYWDGRNEIGEQVASGIYIYHLQLQTGALNLSRKMVVLK